MKWTIPNQITVARIVLAGVFFALLGCWNPAVASLAHRALMNVAFAVFLLAVISDVLDGYIARKYDMASTFGRMVDPIVDKVLILGTFIMLCGRTFAIPQTWPGPDGDLPWWTTGGMVSGVQAWMVVLILARELVISGVRGFSESQGIQFPATPAGKIKMLVQSITIGVVLFQLANRPESAWAVYLKVSLVWLTLIVTVGSGFYYLRRARKLLLGSDESPDER